MATRTIANGGGNWNVNSTWVENAQPTASDDVVATATSGNVVVTGTCVCRSMDLSLYTGTMSGSSTLSIGTTTANASLFALRVGSSATLTTTGTWAFIGTYTTNALEISMNGKAHGGATTFGTASTWRMTSAFGATTLTHTAGTLNLNGQTVTLSSTSTTAFQSTGTTTRTLTLGAATINATGVNITGSGLTFSGASSTINLQASGTSVFFNAGIASLTFGTITSTAQFTQLGSLSFTCANFTKSSTAINHIVVINQGTTMTCTGTFTCTGNNATNRVWLAGATTTALQTPGTTATLALGAAGTAVTTYTDFMDMVFTGTNTPVTGTSIGNALGNTGVTGFASARTLYWVGGSGNWSDTAHWSTTSGGSGGQPVPLPQDDVIIDDSSFSANSQSIAVDTLIPCRSLTGNVSTWTGITLTNATSATVNQMGSISLTGVSQTGSWFLSMRGRSASTFAAPSGWTGTLACLMVGSTLTLTGPISGTTISVIAGTVDLNSINHSVSSLGGTTGTIARGITFGSSVLTATASASFGTAASSYTLTPGTGTLRMTTASSTTLNGNGQVGPSLELAHTGTITLTGDWYSPSTVTHSSGTLAISTFSMSAGTFTSSGSTSRSITTGTGGNIAAGNIDFSGSNLSLSWGASAFVKCSPLVKEGTFNTGDGSLPAVYLSPIAGGEVTVLGGGACNALTIQAPAGTCEVSFIQQLTILGTAVFDATGNSSTNRIKVYGPPWGGTTTLSASTSNIGNIDFINIDKAGTATWTGTSVTTSYTGWRAAMAAT